MFQYGGDTSLYPNPTEQHIASKEGDIHFSVSLLVWFTYLHVVFIANHVFGVF